MPNIKGEIIDILADQLGIDVKKIREDSILSDDLGADSLDTVEIVHVFEDKFSIQIPNDDLANVKTVKDIIDYIGKKTVKE